MKFLFRGWISLKFSDMKTMFMFFKFSLLYLLRYSTWRFLLLLLLLLLKWLTKNWRRKITFNLYSFSRRGLFIVTFRSFFFSSGSSILLNGVLFQFRRHFIFKPVLTLTFVHGCPGNNVIAWNNSILLCTIYGKFAFEKTSCLIIKAEFVTFWQLKECSGALIHIHFPL